MHMDILLDEVLIKNRLKEVGYYANLDTAIAIRNAYILKKPLLIEGPPGVGKTQLAKSLQKILDCNWFRLQCTPEITERKAVYEMDYQKQLLYIQLYKDEKRKNDIELEKSFFTREFLIERPLLQSMQQEAPSVLLVDEIDKAPEEFEYSLLEIFGEYSVTIPELKETIYAKEIPFTVITSNNTRPISETILRRCIYLYLDYPTLQEETTIIQTIANVNDEIAKAVAKAMKEIRQGHDMKLKQKPSISEGLEWAKVISLHLQRKDEDSDETASSIRKGMLRNISVIAKSKDDHKKISKKIESMTI